MCLPEDFSISIPKSEICGEIQYNENHIIAITENNIGFRDNFSGTC